MEGEGGKERVERWERMKWREGGRGAGYCMCIISILISTEEVVIALYNRSHRLSGSF